MLLRAQINLKSSNKKSDIIYISIYYTSKSSVYVIVTSRTQTDRSCSYPCTDVTIFPKNLTNALIYSVLSGTVVSKTGNTSIDEDPRSGRPSTSTEDVHIDTVRDLILQNRRLTIREIAEVT